MAREVARYTITITSEEEGRDDAGIKSLMWDLLFRLENAVVDYAAEDDADYVATSWKEK